MHSVEEREMILLPSANAKSSQAGSASLDQLHTEASCLVKLRPELCTLGDQSLLSEFCHPLPSLKHFVFLTLEVLMKE